MLESTVGYLLLSIDTTTCFDLNNLCEALFSVPHAKLYQASPRCVGLSENGAVDHSPAVVPTKPVPKTSGTLSKSTDLLEKTRH
jgi:hypothetical protein